MRRQRMPALLTSAAATILLAGCGGGGSPTGPVTTPVTTPAPTPAAATPAPVATPAPAPAATPAATPSTVGAEYLRNPGLALMKVAGAWGANATGAGQTIAILDTGVDASAYDLTGKVSAGSVDIVSSRAASDASSSHATNIAGVIAANFNGVGTVGAAYNAHILSVRIDSPGSCATDCSFSTANMARGIDYAVSQGARIINLSLGDSATNGAYFEAALKRAVDAGVVVVAAAGNDGSAESIYPARYATDTRFKGAVIAAGALNATGSDIATFSNRAGSAADGYLLAPGQSIRTNCDAAGTCTVVSGTSFATPHVAAALALLMEEFPTLTGKQAVDILLRTATDMGPSGTDSTYGRGALNVTAAMSPVGGLSVESPTGTSSEAAGASRGVTAAMGAAFGGAVERAAPDLKTVGFDDYHRMYKLDLAKAYVSQGRRSAVAPALAPARQSSQSVALAEGGELRLTARKSIAPLYQPGGMSALAEVGREDAVQMSYRAGGVAFDLWSGKAGFSPVAAGQAVDAYSNLAFARQTARAAYDVGRWSLSAEQGFGERGDDVLPDYVQSPNLRQTQGTAYSKFTAQTGGQAWAAAVSAGFLTEQGGPLGSALPTGSAYALPSGTRYLQGQVSWQPQPGFRLSATAAAGDTRARGAAMMLSARSTSWSLRADAACAALCSGMSLSLSQPVRVEAGTLSALLADTPNAYLDPLSYSWRRASLSPEGRELDIGLSAWRDLGAAGMVSVQANAFTQEGNMRNAPVNLGLTAGWSRRF